MVQNRSLNLADCKGDWVLVTGASSGIGREFCIQLARTGMNIVLVARREQLLHELSAQLQAEHGIRTMIICLDLSEPNAPAEVQARVAKNNVRIRLLVNNAAFGPWGRFEKASPELYEALIRLVAATPISLCLRFLPDLATFPSSAIVNLSSPAALQPVPYKAAYSAAKTCLHNFSLALHEEWKERGILVQTLLPGPTQSELDAKGGAYKSELPEARRPPSEIVRASLFHLAKGTPLVTTNKGTYKQRVFAGVFPVGMVIREVAKMFRPPTDQR